MDMKTGAVKLHTQQLSPPSLETYYLGGGSVLNTKKVLFSAIKTKSY